MYLRNSEGHLHGNPDTYIPLHDGIETKEGPAKAKTNAEEEAEGRRHSIWLSINDTINDGWLDDDNVLIMKKLLEQGADPNQKDGADPNQKDGEEKKTTAQIKK